MSMTRALAIDESEHGVRVNRCVSFFISLSLSHRVAPSVNFYDELHTFREDTEQRRHHRRNGGSRCAMDERR